MRIKDIYKSALLATTLLAVGCTSDEVAPDVSVGGRTVEVQLTVNRGGAMTRASLAETSGEDGTMLSNLWESGDILRVYDSNGDEAGTLTLLEGVGSADGIFTGTLTNFSEDDEYCLWYIDEKAKSIVTIDNANKNIIINVKDQSFKSVADLEAANVMSVSGVKFSKAGSAFSKDLYNNTADVIMEPKLAMVHFSFPEIAGKTGKLVVNVNNPDKDGISRLPVKWPYSLATGEDTGSKTHSAGINVAITEENTKDNSVHVYLALIQNHYKFSFSFTDDEDNSVWNYVSETQNDITAGYYYTGENGDGVKVSLTQSGNGGSGDNNGDDDIDSYPVETAGPTFEIDGKKYRFTSGNLWYNYSTKTYGIYDTQIEYLGKWYNNSSNTTNVIDLFSWGTTGLDQSRAVEIFDTKLNGYGGYFPTEDDQLNAQINDVVNQHDRMYDFGYAYMLKGRNEADKRDYRMPSQDQLNSLFNGSAGCFFQGCTIKENGKTIYGTIVIPNISTASQAKELLDKLKSEGASYSSSYLKDINPNRSNKSFSLYNVSAISLSKYSLLKNLNNALFFPAAGNVVASQGSTTEKRGQYWGANASSIWSSQRNAYGFSHTGNSFTYDYSGGAYIKSAIRLLVEVTE